MLSLVIGLKGIAEIYDVCTAPESRRLGYARQLFKNVFEFVNDYISRIWLSIDLNQNPQTIDDLFRFYSNFFFFINLRALRGELFRLDTIGNQKSNLHKWK